MYTWADNAAFQGEWESSQLNGAGTYTDELGQPWVGEVFQTNPATLIPKLAQ
jgi:hypothetical protein